MRTWVSKIILFVKQVLFPLFCLSCEKEGGVICENCEALFLEQKALFVKQGIFVSRVIAPFVYTEKELPAKLLHEWKYGFIEETEDVFRKSILVFCEREFAFFAGITDICFVPLYKKRQAERGFNQSERIAKILGEVLGLPVAPFLKRVSFRCPQVGLSGEERKLNVLDAFKIQKSPEGKNILLVDDVFTTGSTLEECARVLKNKNAAEVRGFCLLGVLG